MKGRDPVSGLPRRVEIASAELREALESSVADIVAEVKAALEETPPELAADLPERGILLAGGSVQLRGFAARLEHETHVPVRVTDSPLTCVALGAGQALEELETLERGRAA